MQMTYKTVIVIGIRVQFCWGGTQKCPYALRTIAIKVALLYFINFYMPSIQHTRVENNMFISSVSFAKSANYLNQLSFAMARLAASRAY